MKKAKINPLSADHSKKVVLDEDEYSDSEPVELICPSCNTNTIVTITDQAGNSDKFCKRCSCVYNEEDNIIRHRQRLLPPLEPEPAAATNYRRRRCSNTTFTNAKGWCSSISKTRHNSIYLLL